MCFQIIQCKINSILFYRNSFSFPPPLLKWNYYDGISNSTRLVVIYSHTYTRRLCRRAYVENTRNQQSTVYKITIENKKKKNFKYDLNSKCCTTKIIGFRFFFFEKRRKNRVNRLKQSVFRIDKSRD